MKRIFRSTAALTLSATMLLGPAVLAAPTAFSDLPSNHWAYTHIYKAVQDGLVSGNTDGTYQPDNAMALKDFGTMICSLMYPGADKAYAGKSASWWYQYVEAVYQKGALNGTTAAAKRTADGYWTASHVEKDPLTRYDMAQIIYNAAKSQGWSEPSSTETTYAYYALMNEKIPAQYTQAVLYCYAKGFLAGMGDGTFSGNKSMTRAQAAVVLNAMNAVKKKLDAPTYTNNKNLVNGKEPTEDNVAKAVADLKADFPAWSSWNMDRSYTSSKLGSAVGSQAFAYMFSDKVFGNMSATKQTNTDRIKVGDLVYLRDVDRYGVVSSVGNKDFEYVYCDSMGLVSWSGSFSRADLDKNDTIWTRYEGKNLDSLANGKQANEDNVISILEDLQNDRTFGDGESWNKDDYTSDVFGDADDENESFAYALSDEIFGDLEKYTIDEYDIRPGDLVRLNDHHYGYYAIVLDVDTRNDTFYYVWAYDENLRDFDVEWEWGKNADPIDMADITRAYSRYPEKSDDDRNDSTKDGELTNGKPATERNVGDLLDSYYDDRTYGQDRVWDMSKRYNTTIDGSVKGGAAFAFKLSDEIFGSARASKLKDFDDIKLGDVFEYQNNSNGNTYGVILSISRSGDITYATTDTNGNITWNNKGLKLDKSYDTVWTRY